MLSSLNSPSKRDRQRVHQTLVELHAIKLAESMIDADMKNLDETYNTVLGRFTIIACLEPKSQGAKL